MFSTDRTRDPVRFLILIHHSHHLTHSLLHQFRLSRPFEALIDNRPKGSMSLTGICVAFGRASVTARPEREEETMRKGISLGTAIVLAGFLGLTLPGCSEDRNSSGTGGDAGKSSGSATGSKSSPGGGSSSTGAGGSATGSGSSGSAGGSGTGPGGSGS
jgi:hypothetical protein